MNGRAIKRASLTVECAAVLPLFFFAALTLLMFMNAVRITASESLALSNRARKLSAAAGLLESGSGSSGETDSGGDGIWIDLRKTYTYKHPFSLFGLPDIRVSLRARVYPWIGSDTGISGTDSGEDSGEDGELVYITDNESVYHTHADCTHLDLTIIKTTASEVRNLRNADGRRYKKCRGFPAGYTGPVYVSARGTYYYPSTEYGSLTRHVHITDKSDTAGLPICSRCAARDRKGDKAA